MEKKINDAVYRYGMEDIFNGAIVGFSGGADSSCLLHFLKSRCKRLVAVHINHMIRGEEAMRDEEFCKRVCQSYGIEIRVERIDIPRLSAERRCGMEETARKERYRVFNEILKGEPDLSCIVTAHNANDNAETIIFNLTRGSGLNGISGIKPVNGEIFRPLINCTRQEIIKYCSDNNIEYVTDSTNLEDDYTRNSIRHNVIPQLEKINEGLITSCTRLSEILRQDDEYIEKRAEEAISENGIVDKIEISLFSSLDDAIISRVLKRLCPVDLDYKSVCACIDLARAKKTGKMINLSKGITFKVERTYACFLSNEKIKEVKINTQLELGENYIEGLGIVICINSQPENEAYIKCAEVTLDSANVFGKLYVRSKQDGDVIKNGGVTKKLKRVFTDKHIPSHLRDKLPIICDEQGVLAVPSVIARDGAFSKKGDIKIKVYKKA